MIELVAIPEGWNAWLDHWPWKASYPSWLRPASAQPHISPATKKRFHLREMQLAVILQNISARLKFTFFIFKI